MQWVEISETNTFSVVFKTELEYRINRLLVVWEAIPTKDLVNNAHNSPHFLKIKIYTEFY